jgi:hypothetical protein
VAGVIHSRQITRYNFRLEVCLAALVLCGTALAQTSTSFQLEEYTLNAGGTPSHGIELSSTSFSITVASIGDTLVAVGLGSSSFGLDVGFDVAYPPPGEVGGLLMIDPQTLVWSAESSAGVYTLYRDDTGDGYGNCEEQEIAATTTTDAATPTPNNTFYYLVTVKNRLAEEGTKGFQSNATERVGGTGLPACP